MKKWFFAVLAVTAFALSACGTEMNLQGAKVNDVGTATPTALGTLRPDGKIGVCHRTSSDTNPWVYIVIDASAIPAHQQHNDVFGVSSQTECDVITANGTPTPINGIPTATPFATMETATPTLYAPTSTPVPGATNTPGAANNGKVGICHHTGANSNPYVYIVVSQNAVPAHQKHGDIIGVSSPNDCPTTAVDNSKKDKDDKDKDKDKDKKNKNKKHKD